MLEEGDNVHLMLLSINLTMAPKTSMCGDGVGAAGRYHVWQSVCLSLVNIFWRFLQNGGKSETTCGIMIYATQERAEGWLIILTFGPNLSFH